MYAAEVGAGNKANTFNKRFVSIVIIRRYVSAKDSAVMLTLTVVFIPKGTNPMVTRLARRLHHHGAPALAYAIF